MRDLKLNDTVDFEKIKEVSAARTLDVLFAWFPEGKVEGKEFRIGDVKGSPGKSLGVNVHTCVWSDFSSEHAGGDLISLNAARIGGSQLDGAKDLAAMLGIGGGEAVGIETAHKLPPVTKVKQESPGVEDTFEVQAKVPDRHPPLPTKFWKKAKNKKFASFPIVKTWAYRTGSGDIAGFTCRVNYPPSPDNEFKATKDIVPLTWSVDQDGNGKWTFKGMKRPHHLYGSEYLVEHPDRTVIIVSGEKTADAARRLLPTCVVVTWTGGDFSFLNTDWSMLKNRKVVLIPDADESGLTGAYGHDQGGKKKKGLLQKLKSITPYVSIVVPPEGTASGWDLADAEEEEWTEEQTLLWIKENIEKYQLPDDFEEDNQNARNRERNSQPSARSNPGNGDDDREEGDVNDVTEDEDITLPFGILGYNKDTFYFFSRGGQVVSASSQKVCNKSFLFTLADNSFWERNYPSRQGFSHRMVEVAGNHLITASYRRGIFNPDNVRGRGAWWDQGRSVFHVGTQLIVDGIPTKFRDFKTTFIYEQAFPISFSITPLEKKESAKLFDLCAELHWERSVFARLFAGWCVIAPICGALKWRPHLWLTSSAGAGKSWAMREIAIRCLGPLAFEVLGPTTEPGIRQTLQSDARPVVFDEAEPDNQRSATSIEAVLQLMRQSSSDGSAKIVKGTSAGTSVSFAIRSCFLLASINVPVKQESDSSRITVLSLKKRNSIENQTRFKTVVEPKVKQVLTEQFCLDLQARAVQNIRVIRANTETFSIAVGNFLRDQRKGDQMGAMLAGAYLLVSDDLVTIEQAEQWVAEQVWDDIVAGKESSDEERLMAKLMESRIMVRDGKYNIERNLAELIENASLRTTDVDVTKETAESILNRIGIRTGYVEEELCVFFSNSHSGIRELLEDSPWVANWGRTLLRIDGAAKTAKTVNFKGSVTRATSIPLAAIFS